MANEYPSGHSYRATVLPSRMQAAYRPGPTRSRQPSYSHEYTRCSQICQWQKTSREETIRYHCGTQLPPAFSEPAAPVRLPTIPPAHPISDNTAGPLPSRSVGTAASLCVASGRRSLHDPNIGHERRRRPLRAQRTYVRRTPAQPARVV